MFFKICKKYAKNIFYCILKYAKNTVFKKKKICFLLKNLKIFILNKYVMSFLKYKSI